MSDYKLTIETTAEQNGNRLFYEVQQASRHSKDVSQKLLRSAPCICSLQH